MKKIEEVFMESNGTLSFWFKSPFAVGNLFP